MAATVWQTACVRCDPGRAGRGGECKEDCRAQNARANDPARTECVCPADFYDTQTMDTTGTGRRKIFCWDRDRKTKDDSDEADPTASTLNNDLSLEALEAGKRCIPCPDCVTCDASTSNASREEAASWSLLERRNSIVVKAGFSETFAGQEWDIGDANQRHPDAEINIYRCPEGASCTRSFSLSDVQNKSQTEARQAVCGEDVGGVLCSTCDPNFYWEEDPRDSDRTICESCGDTPMLRVMGMWAAYVAAFFLLRFLWRKYAPESTAAEAEKKVRVMQKSWPRLSQSFRIFVTNVQITTNIARTCEIDWKISAPTFAAFLSYFDDLVNVDIFHVPGLTCISGGYLSKWGTKILFLPICGLVIYLFYLRAVRNLLMEEAKKEADAQERFSGLRGPAASRTKEQALSEPLSGDSAESGDDDGGAGLAHTRTDRPDIIRTRTDELEGEPEEIRLARRKLSLKLQLVVKLGRVKTRFNDIAFMVVYLAYPSVSSKCFEILRPCLEFEDVQRLAADLSVSCADSDYKLFQYFAWVAVFALPFGIPAFLFYKLWDNRETVKKNPEYVTLVSYKPLFQFCKRAARHLRRPCS